MHTATTNTRPIPSSLRVLISLGFSGACVLALFITWFALVPYTIVGSRQSHVVFGTSDAGDKLGLSIVLVQQDVHLALFAPVHFYRIRFWTSNSLFEVEQNGAWREMTLDGEQIASGDGFGRAKILEAFEMPEDYPEHLREQLREDVVAAVQEMRSLQGSVMLASSDFDLLYEEDAPRRYPTVLRMGPGYAPYYFTVFGYLSLLGFVAFGCWFAIWLTTRVLRSGQLAPTERSLACSD